MHNLCINMAQNSIKMSKSPLCNCVKMFQYARSLSTSLSASECIYSFKSYLLQWNFKLDDLAKLFVREIPATCWDWWPHAEEWCPAYGGGDFQSKGEEWFLAGRRRWAPVEASLFLEQQAYCTICITFNRHLLSAICECCNLCIPKGHFICKEKSDFLYHYILDN